MAQNIQKHGLMPRMRDKTKELREKEETNREYNILDNITPGVGFEPTRPLVGHRLSRPAPLDLGGWSGLGYAGSGYSMWHGLLIKINNGC